MLFAVAAAWAMHWGVASTSGVSCRTNAWKSSESLLSSSLASTAARIDAMAVHAELSRLSLVAGFLGSGLANSTHQEASERQALERCEVPAWRSAPP